MKFSLAILSSILSVASANGVFNVLNLNVNGIPDSNDARQNATELIGNVLAKLKDDYDVVHVQDDYNFHSNLYTTDTHPFRTETSGNLFTGDGLNTLSNYDFFDFERITWNKCAASEGYDCVTAKGFTSMRLKLEDGVYVHLINLDANAGEGSDHQEARNNNLDQVLQYIEKEAYGEAVILFGNTNSLYTTEGDEADIFATKLYEPLTDAWSKIVLHNKAANIQDNPACLTPANNRECETADKVLYRSSRAVNLDVTGFNYVTDKFTSYENVLVNHNPVLANFSYVVKQDYKFSNLTGTKIGNFFNDINAIPAGFGIKVSHIQFNGNETVYSVQAKLSNDQNYIHGDETGDSKDLWLAKDEYWTKATVCEGDDKLTYIQAVTTKNNTVTVGVESNDCYDYTSPEGYQIAGFYGNANNVVRRLGFISLKI